MRAQVFQHLEKKTRLGRTVIVVIIRGKKNEIVEKVNRYIAQRILTKNLIKVSKFNVVIKDEGYYSGRVVNHWEYIPTYR